MHTRCPAAVPDVQGDAGHTAALVIAKVAAVELPRKEWPELIQALLANMAAAPSTKELRQSTLEALGYICEELSLLEDDYLSQQEVNAILTAVVQVRGSAVAAAAVLQTWRLLQRCLVSLHACEPPCTRSSAACAARALSPA